MTASGLTPTATENARAQPSVPASEHGLDPANINPGAKSVLDTLADGGYQAYLVGGCVRDMLLGIKPKDFDIVTDARPPQIKKLFPRCHLIGRRFRLAHVRVGKDIIEVSTFRASADGDRHHKNGVIVRDNVYGRLEDDVWRRDFTANALYYNITDHSIVDHVGGITDIRNRQLKSIGDAQHRYREDPVRMLRAIRLAGKLNFSIHADSRRPIRHLAPLLKQIPAARLFQECLKIFASGCSLKIYQQLHKYRLFGILFPQTDHCLNTLCDSTADALLRAAFASTDRRLAEKQSVTPSFLLAALLWTPMQNLVREAMHDGLPKEEAEKLANEQVIAQQIKNTAMPKKLTAVAKIMWRLQDHLTDTRRDRALKLLEHRHFRAAYDFLLLRAESGEADMQLADWWTMFQHEHPDIGPPARKTQRPRHYRRRPAHNCQA